VKTTTLTLLTIVVLVPGPLHAAETWHEIKSDHFILRTNAGENVGRQTVEDLEKFRFTVGSITNIDYSSRDLPPLTVYGYRKTRQYEKRQDKPSSAGYFSPRAHGAVAVMSLEKKRRIDVLGSREIVYHELTHYLLDRYSPSYYPYWYNEGFAEFLSTMRFESDKAIIGDPATARLLILTRTSQWLPMRVLAGAKNRYLSSAPGRKGIADVSFQYAQGWLITHMLNTSEDLHPGIAPYIEQINAGTNDEEAAFTAAFGIDYAALDRRLKLYWSDKALPYMVFKLQGVMPAIHVISRTMPAAEAAIMDSESRLQAGRLDSGKLSRRAAKLFNAALTAGVRPVDMRYYLAAIAFDAEKYDEARLHLDALFAAQPQHAPASELAALLRAETRKSKDWSDEDFTAVATLYRQALDADPTYLPAHYGYLQLHFAACKPLAGDDIARSETYLRREHKQPAAQFLYARLLMLQHNNEAALDIIKRQLAWASTEDYAGLFNELLSSVTVTAPISPSEDASTFPTCSNP